MPEEGREGGRNREGVRRRGGGREGGRRKRKQIKDGVFQKPMSQSLPCGHVQGSGVSHMTATEATQCSS